MHAILKKKDNVHVHFHGDEHAISFNCNLNRNIIKFNVKLANLSCLIIIKIFTLDLISSGKAIIGVEKID